MIGHISDLKSKKSHKTKASETESGNTYAVRRGKSMLYDAYKI
jgi:hypothetical protein